MKGVFNRSSGLLIVLLWCIGIAACQRESTTVESAQPQVGAATEGTGDDERILASHDDPIVIDNAPIRIALGGSPSSSNDQDWSRHLHALDYIAVLRRDPNGMVVFKEHVPLCRAKCTITLGLVRGASNHVTTHFVFEATPGDEGQLVMKDENRRKFREAERWLKPLDPGNSSKDDDLWIRTILVEELGATEPLLNRDFGRGGANYQVDIVIVTKEAPKLTSPRP